MNAYRIAWLPGDGIGPEVTSAARFVLEALPLRLEWRPGAIGLGAFERLGTPLPDETLQLIQHCDAALFGAVTTPVELQNYRSPVLRMRQELDLYANLRPCRSLPHATSREGVDLLVVRENTEDLYVGAERLEQGGERAVGEMIITRHASRRVMQAACEAARKRDMRRVTVVHKANVLRETCGLFRRSALEVAKQEYPDLQVDEMLVDTCAMELIRAPQLFQVIVTTNLFGDILSDEASMLVGGLGVAASGNIGEGCAVFEPVHGSAPALAGTRQANPLAAILSAALLLDYLGEAALARRVEQAVERVVRAGQLTPDLGGTETTEGVAQAVVGALEGMA